MFLHRRDENFSGDRQIVRLETTQNGAGPFGGIHRLIQQGRIGMTRDPGLPAEPLQLLFNGGAPALGIEPVWCGDPRYPALLGCTEDPPPVLWTKGSLVCLDTPCVAVIGSRAATPYVAEPAPSRASAAASEAASIRPR